MGNCFSDVKGGKQAVGGGSIGGGGVHPGSHSTVGGGANDAVELFFRTRGMTSLSTEIELSLSASKLRDRDITSKSDPMAVVYIRKRNGALEELGRTEVIMNNLDPSWIQKIFVTYQFETVQPLAFRVYDVDTKYHNVPVKLLKLEDQDFLGEANCSLAEIITKKNRSLTVNLHDQHEHGLRKLGTVTVLAEEMVSSRSAVEMTLCCHHLANKDLFSKSDPFLIISRISEHGGKSIPICKTEVVDNNLNPAWKPLCLTSTDKDSPLLIECFDFNTSGNHVLIGKLQKTMADLKNLHITGTGANLMSPPSHFREVEKVSGMLFVKEYIEKELFSFIDYISSGFELNFMVAVDFTASNGNPHNSNSLHYIDPLGRLNAYQQAIMEVGDVIQFYDSDRQFPAWGFGGDIGGGNRIVSHCFNLNGIPDECEVTGLEGIMAAYSTALANVRLSGPTIFGHVIDRAANIASRSLSTSNHTKYFVLLIITDGVVTNLQETIDALVRASDLPLSILIVGVGGADFAQMEILDADSGKRLESSTGRIATRDIVQFVPMRHVHGKK